MVIAHYCVEHISVQGEIYMDKIMMWIMAICALIGERTGCWGIVWGWENDLRTDFSSLDRQRFPWLD